MCVRMNFVYFKSVVFFVELFNMPDEITWEAAILATLPYFVLDRNSDV